MVWNTQNGDEKSKIGRLDKRKHIQCMVKEI